ncbi:MAG: TlpA family protein disulfide reductase [Myxococcota bacterium]|nr:TlpA family protein disulfide reductase [Myxococcota bacterium]MDW8362076.1 TlpA disulfide reductase family protein [Myxococcales bacterium]
MKALDALRIYWPAAAIPAVVVAATIGGRCGGCVGGAGRLVGHPVPRFSAPLVAGPGAAESDHFDPGRQTGRVLVLDFWASWCPPCRDSVPVLNRLAERFANAPVTFMGINVDTDARIAASAHASLGMRYGTVHDAGGSIQSDFRILSLPTLVLVDTRGVVRDVQSGVPDEAELAGRITELLRAAGTP